ncbi:hypothetical protein [Defluviitalea phaphyphila]|uniref:hypothetical protein n=1 Tax=Defluviitalea phaphyphila TaxID=1473580 RepID=UPI000730800B|nr:hypothetical protein [Defluviitalea phaphyphila]
MDNDIKAMFKIILDRLDSVDSRLDKVDSRLDKVDSRLDKVDSRLDKVDSRLDKLETELHDFRLEMREEIRGLDTKIDLIYNKLNSEIEELKNNEPKFKIVREK